MSLEGKRLFITGASRGIGLAIALAAAKEGARIAIAAKTAEPHKHLPGTIYTAAEAIEKAGGEALPLVVDIREEAAVVAAVEEAASEFGGLDICVNNASAINLSRTPDLEMKRFDLMHQVNARGTFMVSKTCIPHLQKAENPHVLTLSPPLDLDPKWFAPHVGYSMAKFGMSLCMFGMAGEFARDGIAFNALWPRTTIATAAIEFALRGSDALRQCRKPEIMGDAAVRIFKKNSKSFTGKFLIDDTFLYEEGVTDFDQYRNDVSVKLLPDFFVPDHIPAPPGVAETIDMSVLEQGAH